MLAGSTVEAQTVDKRLTRSFNECQFPAQYVFDYSFFTATGTEAVLTFNRTHTACSQVCQPIPFPGGTTSCDQGCSPTIPCPNGWICSCSAPFCFGQCVAGVDVNVGYVVVLKSSRFCAIAACASQNPIGCPPSTCDGSGICSDATSNAESLCLCPDPACPIGQRICNSERPTIPPADLVSEAFDSASNPAWVLGLATISGNVLRLNGTSTPTSLAQVRFPTQPGQEYVVVVKWTSSPIVSGFQSCPDASLLLSLETRPGSCGP